ncbi:G-protein coupled receptor GRL101-like [Mercenaria mercenaria]|uniref:G-protein coupled receptor GRL101-like n=1 Tax=Mercenaria mercenaria TaxID=6596 RepID=UPI00234E3A30|nr:G-protein coupled receptor GRL101-like [Mercenaria mercenaria]
MCPNNCTCDGYTAHCSGQSYNVFNFLSSSIRILDASHCSGLNGTLDIQMSFFFLIELNSSYSNIELISKESFSHTKNLLRLDLSYNLLTIIQSNLFKNLKYLRMLHLLGNRLISVIEPTAFNGLTLKEITLSYMTLNVILKESFGGLNLTKLDLSHSLIETVEDFAFERLIVNELDITFNPIKNFGKAMFNGLVGLQKLKTPQYKFCCIRPIYLEEKNCFPHRDEFSSCGDLMRRTSLQFFLWIISILAISGNIFSIAFRIFFDEKRLKMVYGIFVTNLAVADLLMGMYMLIIAIADRVYRGRYIEEDEYWRRSAWCTLAGVLSTVSSEASVLFICLITVDRLLVIKYPFGSVRISKNLAKMMALSCWIVCFLVAILPIVQSSYFGDQFYSKSGVCLALPLTKDRSTGWLYSISVFIGFNFITFIMIALGQTMIYYEVRHQSSVMKKKSSARRNDLKVARNLLLLVTTDFACWFPIGCMGMLSLNGHTIPGEVYAWTAVLVLPINSAINPFLYTIMAIISSKKFSPSINEQQSIPEYVKGQRKGFRKACYGIWFPDPKLEFDVVNPKSDAVLKLKPDDLLWIFLDVFKSLHLHHIHGMCYKDISAEHVLVYIPSNRKYGGVRIGQKPVGFSRNTETKQDINMVGEILKPLVKC